MTETPPEESLAATPRGRHADLALARVEAKLDLVIAQTGMRLEEHSRRIGAVETRQDETDRRVSSVELEQAEERGRVSQEPPRTPSATWISLGISALLALLIVIEKYGPGVP